MERHNARGSEGQPAYDVGPETQPTAGPYSIGSDHWPGLSKLIEECGEVIQVAGKLLGSGGEAAHWDGSDLRERLEEELGDLRAATSFVIEHNGLDRQAVATRAHDKREMFDLWHDDQGGMA